MFITLYKVINNVSNYICCMNSYISRIIEARKNKGLKQKEMAVKLGITQVSYSQIETGKTELTFSRLEKIANILDLDLKSLLWPNEKNEADRLKFLAFQALEIFESNRVLLKLFEYNTDDPEQSEKYSKYTEEVREFKNGVYNALITLGFCTKEDIKEFKQWLYNNANKHLKQNPLE